MIRDNGTVDEAINQCIGARDEVRKGEEELHPSQARVFFFLGGDAV